MRYLILLLMALPGLAETPRHFQASGPAVSGSAALSLFAYGLAPSAMATDPAGNIYVTGSTQSNVFFATSGAVQPAYGGGTCIPFGPPVAPKIPQPCSDAFVVKLDPAGDIVYATYLGGNGDDHALAIAADAEGNAYVAGTTSANASGANNFPITVHALNSTPQNMFLVKLNSSGSSFIYSTFLPLFSIGLAVDSQGEAIVAGSPDISQFHTTAGAFQETTSASATFNTGAVVKLSADGSALVYATYLGGSAAETDVAGLAVDAAGDAYVSGDTSAADFPVTPGAFQTVLPKSGTTGFVVKLNPAGSALVYATFLGGSGQDSAGTIKVDAAGEAYVLGSAGSTDFPVTAGAFQQGASAPWAPGAAGSAFLAKLNTSGTGLVYATYLSGAGALDVDASGDAYVLGSASAGFPVTGGAFQRCMNGGGADAFALHLAPDGSNAGATYLGGSGSEIPTAIAALPDGQVVVAGTTNSSDFPGVIGAASGQYLLFVEALQIDNPQVTNGPCMALALQNGASFTEGPVAPVEIVTIRGDGIGPAQPAYEQVGTDGNVTTQLAGVQVFFDDTPAPLLYVQSNQINAIVPRKTSTDFFLHFNAQVHVEYNGVSTNTVSVPVAEASPGIFINDYTTQQGTVLNQDGTPNSASNPAKQGSVISIFGTGGSFVQSVAVDGSFWPPAPLLMFASPATVTIGGFGADVLYAGSAPGQISGLFQINAVVPANLPVAGTESLTVQVAGSSSRPLFIVVK